MQTEVSPLRAEAGAMAPVRPALASRDAAIDALRSCVTLLVVAHHAVLAYHPQMPPAAGALTGASSLWMAFPVIDPKRWPGIDLFVGFNDIFFMALLFFLSGLYAWPSLARKGPRNFLRDRLLRLGIPFLVSALVLAPLAYLPAYLQRNPKGDLGDYLHQWLSLPSWPAGPAWFLWVLLSFDLLAAALFRLAPHLRSPRKPMQFFALLVFASALAYLPLALIVSPLDWFSFGPFFVQSSRVGHYAIYFFAGAAIGPGAAALTSLGRRWFAWAPSALLAFALAIGVFIAGLGAGFTTGWQAAGALAFVLSCACSSFAFLAAFERFASRGGILARLSPAAYGIYLLHYAIVSWLQYALLGVDWPGAAKGIAVIGIAIALSATLTVGLKRSPAVARVL